MMTFTDGLYGVLQSEGWQSDSIVFSGHLTILGVDCEIRQTVTRRSDSQCHVLNEEKLPDGAWLVTDEYENRKQ